MSLRFAALVAALSLAVVDDASANGRPPGTSTINFKRGDDQTIAAGMTFGLIISTDGGATWNWVCEDAVGYGGMYDPDYALAADGTLFGTTFNGLVANRDGCTFVPTTLGTKFVSRIALGPTGALHVASADDNDGHIYRSTDGGMTFPTMAMPGQLKDWWAAIAVAPSNADIVWISGYRLVPSQPKVHLVFKSVNGGESFTPLAPTSIDDFAVMANSTIEIAGFSPTDANVVYARVTLADNSQSDALYRSDDGGTSWTKLLEKRDSLSFLVRANGDLVAATQQVTDTSCDAMATDCLGAFVSKNGGQTWTALPNPPHVTCLEENGAGEVWACTQNYGIPGVPKDGFGIMKSSGELQTWTGVMKYQEIAAPVACSAGTVQNDQCNAKLWCGLCAQLACDPQRDCPAEVEVDGPPADAPSMVKPPQDSCCGSSHGGSSLLLGGLVGILLSRRRRALVSQRAPTRR